MATQQHAGNRQKGYWGRFLVMLGSVVLFADLAFLAQPFERLAEKLSEGLFSVLPTVGLSFVHAARYFASHQIDYFSLISRILVLFTAMVALVVGSALWKSTPAQPAHPDILQPSSFREQETDNG